jgi:hypothetical protein
MRSQNCEKGLFASLCQFAYLSAYQSVRPHGTPRLPLDGLL